MIIKTDITTNDRTAYSFTANATEYTVIADSDDRFTVISHRKSLRFPTLNVHTRDEMLKRSKALRNLILFIEADAVAA